MALEDSTDQNRISLEDNSDRTPPSELSSNKMADVQDSNQAQEMSESKENVDPKKSAGDDSSRWETLDRAGNKAGDTVEGYTKPYVGNYTGPALEAVGKPVGAVVGTVANGTVGAGNAFGEMLGVGAGNKDGGPAKAQQAEHEKMKEPLGGKDQTGDNPLGL